MTDHDTTTDAQRLLREARGIVSARRGIYGNLVYPGLVERIDAFLARRESRPDPWGGVGALLRRILVEESAALVHIERDQDTGLLNVAIDDGETPESEYRGDDLVAILREATGRIPEPRPEDAA